MAQKQKTQNAAEELKRKNLQEALALLPEGALEAGLGAAQSEAIVAKGLFAKTKDLMNELKRALAGCKVIDEVLYNLEMVDPVYAALIKDKEAIDLELKQAESPSGVVIGELKPISEIQENQRQANLVLEQYKNKVANGIAPAFKFDDYPAMRQVVKSHKPNFK